MSRSRLAPWDRTKGRPEPIRALNLIRECENGEPLVDMRVAAPSVRVLRPSVIPYVRETVALMCEQAARQLPRGVYLGLIEGWRPLSRQQRIYDFMWNAAITAFPDRDRAALRRTVCRWVAPTDQKAPPGHCTGAAVDVWLVNEQLEQLDVCAPYDRFSAAPTYTLGLAEDAQRNRSLLVESMLAQGFSNCRDEWWHYSYGDAGWAVRLGHDTCIYGRIDLDLPEIAALEADHAEAMRDRPNPFLPAPPTETQP
ncbi:MAG: M15 family metallopeptidase [Fimbriimonadaceae bacterium]|nr:M15 family metallopeptidase [Fimbriimonadaceae bacterium]